MVELQSCASLVNAPALSAIEEEVRGESVSVIAEIAAELQREKEKNAELMERISLLEAQIQERDKDSLQTNKQNNCLDATERSFKKFKRQKLDTSNLKTEDGKVIEYDRECMASKDGDLEDHIVNWMSMDDKQFLLFDKCKESDIAGDCDDTDESDDEDRLDHSRLDHSMLPYTDLANGRDLEKHDKKETEGIGAFKAPRDILISGWESAVSGIAVLNKKPSKVPFCPKEVKRILESDHLSLKNAQSHSIRKIIVFASLGIRHGCEDMYELDFNHFTILRKGEPYVSPKDPGEHVLYENPGVRRKVFYPNQQNPILCPVQILEEESAMRPSDPSCPSCLFLCIKYGGRTRNRPQNEYVRQRMGRNKLKSFGPVMCQMAMLVLIRSGSFFFKALGITLLFMAGFPDDVVQRETKYRNLDLLQKYYRRDEDAKGEELFLSPSTECVTQESPGSSQQITGKTASAKSRGKKQRKSQNTLSLVQESAPSTSAQTSQFGLMGYTSIQTHSMAAFQSQTAVDAPQISNATGKNPSANIPYHIQSPYHMFPPQPANTFMPMIYWPPPSAFPPSPYPGGYGYQSFPSGANCISVHPQPYYNHPASISMIHKVVETGGKDIDSDSSSSSTEAKEVSAN